MFISTPLGYTSVQCVKLGGDAFHNPDSGSCITAPNYVDLLNNRRL